MARDDSNESAPSQATRWYDLFSRGARDWLRHNEKVRDSVKEVLPELVSGSDVLTNPDNRVVKVPVRFLEHYRFKLSDSDAETGAGQGKDLEPGDVLRPAQPRGKGAGGAGTGEGSVEFVLEFKIEDILDWLWEELKLPHLEPKTGVAEEADYVREGWDKRGVRARLDRRRTAKEAVKRRSVQGEEIPFTNEDLRFRQLAKRPRPSTLAVVIFVLDVSSSMNQECRKLAKTFFFWALQGLRRQHSHIDSVFIGHTVNAWEFSEEEFFSVQASGGTEASKAFDLALEILDQRFDPSRYNAYLFYASDGDNFAANRDATTHALESLSRVLNYMGYVELSRRDPDKLNTEMGRIFGDLSSSDARVGSYAITKQEDIWDAMREFFTSQAEQGEE